MEENFLKIKKKYFIVAIVSAVVLGALCGVALASLTAVILKRSAIELHWAVYLAIALVLGAGCGAGLFFILRPKDKTIAKALDKKYSLGEKVQTMVEYRGVQGDMASLQREQADKALSSVVKNRIDVSFLLKFIAVPIIAVAMLFVGIFVPAKKTVAPPPPGFQITENQIIALQNLINDVENSELSEGLKVYCKQSLENLLDDLKETEYQSEMKTKVIATVKSIDTTIASYNSYLKIYYSFKEDETLSEFADAMLGGMTFYKATVTEIKNLEVVGTKSEANRSAIENKLGEWAKSFKGTLCEDSAEGESTDVPKSAQEMYAVVQEYSTKLSNGVAESGIENTDTDALCVALLNFAQELADISSGWSDTTYFSKVSSLTDSFNTLCLSALDSQSYNCIMDEYIRNELARIFGLKVSIFGDNDEVAPDPAEEEGGDSGDETHGGSGGSGEIIYGSEDTIYDPDSGTLVPYGQLLDKYRARYREKILEYEELSSKENATAEEKAEAKYVLSELSKYIDAYYGLLYSGIEDAQ
ncbi:MAG: hypothetical protein ACI4MS_03550 [Candidatus Coproplasma sp.]